MPTENKLLPPAVLFRSFWLVAGAYMLNLVCLLAAVMLISKTMFPESFEIMNSDPENYNRILETDPEKVFPREMLWLLLAISSAVCFCLGYLVARFASISKFSHVVFFAVVLFIQYLQLAIGASDVLQTTLVLFMGVSPVAALLGANLYLQRTFDS